MKIDRIILHHAGPIGSNARTSSAHLTWKSINSAHQARWNFPSEYIKGSFGGYTLVYDPKDRTFHQYRAIGETTAHAIGYNERSIGICLIGNHNGTDELLPHTKVDIINLLIDLCKGNYRDFIIAPNTAIQITPYRIYEHRDFANTDCPGGFVEKDWFKNQVLMRIYPKVPSLSAIQTMIDKIMEQILRIQMQMKALGSVDRSCLGFVNEEKTNE